MRTALHLSMVVSLLAVSPCLAEPTPPLVFRLWSAEDLAGGTKVFKGVEADSTHWRTIIVADLTTAPADYCTATLIGPEAVLTAAHCLKDAQGAVRPAVVRIGGDDWPLACLASPRSNTDDSFDYGLCRLTRPAAAAPLPDGLMFDSIDRTPLADDEPVLLVGYGCETMSIGLDGKLVAGPRVKAFRIGDATVTTAPSGDTPTIVVQSQNQAQPALCPGDSGGPLMTGVTTEDQGHPRGVRGVNTSVVPSTYLHAPSFRSTMAALSHPEFSILLNLWKAANPGAVICGIDQMPNHGPCL